MINYELHPTETTPYVHLDANTGEFCLKGVSIPENATQFFLPIMSWLEGYAQQPQPKTTVHIQLEYFNTSSSRPMPFRLSTFNWVRSMKHSKP